MNKRQHKKARNKHASSEKIRYFKIEPFYSKPMCEYTDEEIGVFSQCSGRAGSDASWELFRRAIDSNMGIPR